MYNPPKPKKDDFSLGRLSLKKARNFTYATVFMAALTVGTSFVLTLRTLQDRDREAAKSVTTTTRARRDTQRVVVIGAGAGGSALAGLLTAIAPHIHVTVIEKERKQTFRALEPHAHVGHRSYDLNTTGAYDSLRSPASWNITRDATLVMGQVVRVDTVAKVVLVRPDAEAEATNARRNDKSAKTAKSAGDSAKTSVRGDGGGGGGDETTTTMTTTKTKKKQSWFQENVPFHMFSSSAVDVDDADATELHQTRADGLVAYPYDALVLATGAERGVTGPLRRLFPLEQLDKYLVAVNPGVTRDNLGQLYEGNVLHIKVPPARLFQLYEQQRLARATAPAHAHTSLHTPRRVGTAQNPLRIPTLDVLDSLATAGAGASSGDLVERDTHAREAAFALASLGTVAPYSGPWTDKLLPATSSTPCRLLYPSLASRLDGFTVPALSYFADCHAARPLDSVFVSTTNLIWKYMAYFNKFNRCQLISISADADPLGPAVPPVVNDVVRAQWSSRQTHDRQHAKGPAVAPADTTANDNNNNNDMEASMPAVEEALRQRFHFLANTYVTDMDYTTRDVTLYNHRDDVYLRIPYRLLVLELPLIAPPFIAASGLARGQAADTAQMAQSGRWWGWWGRRQKQPPQQPALMSSAVDNAASSGPVSALAFATHTPKPPSDVTLDEDSFPDVDPRTLQHARFPDIFALGDVAGVPSVKSYGATFAQVPVVAHNVMQVLFNQKREKQRVAEAKDTKAKAEAEAEAQRARQKPKRTSVDTAAPAQNDTPHSHEEEATMTTRANASVDVLSSSPRTVNAHYHGYTSFHVAMSPWRAFWPESIYSDALEAVLAAGGGQQPASPTATATPDVTETPSLEASAYLVHVDHHLYDNLSWRGVRGFLNGFFIQSSLYENAYFFLFSRGIWYPPHWFKTIGFNVEDGSETSQGFI